jgi:dolichol-phosphate mannosyltransferase
VSASVFFMGGLLLLTLGILGEYVGRVYDEVRNRPLSLISQVHRSSVMVASQVGIKAVQTSAYGIQTEAFALAADQDISRAA